jgi:hypothetical protein
MILDTKDNQKGGGVVNTTYESLITGVMMVVAAYLAWTCNANLPIVSRVLWAGLAALFNSIYLIYYGVYRVMMANPCMK